MERNRRFNSITGNARVVVVTTGGTIVEQYDPDSGGVIPKTSGKELIQSVCSEVNVDNLELVEFSMIDSRAIDLSFLSRLAKLVQEKIADPLVDGIVIVHGTDTMEITAYFLHRTIHPYKKPIVITGAMRVVHNNDYDGKANFTNAIRQANDPQSMENGFGVSINFAGKIHSAVNVTKEHSFAVDPFSSGSFQGIIGMTRPHNIHWLNKPKKAIIIPLPDKLPASVPVVYAYPGATNNYLDGFVVQGFKAIVLVAYGSGNVNECTYQAIESVRKQNCEVILVTNCKYGGVYREYGGIGGNQSLRDLGVIMADDLTPYQAMTVASLVIDNDKLPTHIPMHCYFNNREDF